MIAQRQQHRSASRVLARYAERVSDVFQKVLHAAVIPLAGAVEGFGEPRHTQVDRRHLTRTDAERVEVCVDVDGLVTTRQYVVGLNLCTLANASDDVVGRVGDHQAECQRQRIVATVG